MMKKSNILTCSILLAFGLAACQQQKEETTASGVASGENTVVEIAVNDHTCEQMEVTVPSGQVVFNITNNSTRKLEWEILKGALVVDERENIAPGLSAKMTTTLLPGEYEMTCGLLTNPRGKLIVTDSGFKAPDLAATLLELEQPLADYKVYVQAEVRELVRKTDDFVAAIKAGKLEEAKAMFADTRQHYERIEPIAELFGDLDAAIDAREDDFKDGVNDDEFTGFHRIEYVLWVKNTTDGLVELADGLSKNVHELQTQIDILAFPPSTVVGGAAELIEEVASSKISGEEDRYSHTDLSDFQANVDGSKKIVELFRSHIEAKNPELLKQVEENFKVVDEILAKYKTENGFETYDKLSEEDRKQLQAPINTLAEELGKLRGTLGLD